MSPLINSVIYDVRLLNTEILNYKLLSLYSHKPTVVHLNTLILFFFTRYVVDLCWIYSVLLHDLIRGSFICCHTVSQMCSLNDCRSHKSCGPKSSPNHHLSIIVLDSYYEVFVCGFRQIWCCAL